LLKLLDDLVSEFLHRVAAFGGFAVGRFPSHASPFQPYLFAALSQKRSGGIALVTTALVFPRSKSGVVPDTRKLTELFVSS
jgi:hypothetical protein